VVNSVNSWPPLRMKGTMDIIQILGLVAGTCTSVAAAPQLVKTWKTKNVKDISTRMFLLYVLGNSLWAIYGIYKSDLPIITNIVALIINGCMLYLKKQCGRIRKLFFKQISLFRCPSLTWDTRVLSIACIFYT